MTKAFLFAHDVTMESEEKHKAQGLADNNNYGELNIKVIFLPVAHPKLNPIEHVLGIVKRTVASQNHEFNLKKV